MVSNRAKHALLGILFLFTIAIDEGECACSFVNGACPQGYESLYREGWYDLGQMQTLCCSEVDEIEYFQEKVRECRNTKCMPVGTANPCQTGSDYFADRMTMYNERLSGYIPARNATCSLSGGGKGIGFSCCLASDQSLFLATALGTEYREFPHQANLHGCGGTVYNKRWIITAAHCVVGDKSGVVKGLNDLRVTLGSDISDVQEDSRKYNIVEVRVHDRYSLQRNHSEWRKHPDYRKIFNDIALLKVHKDIVFDDSVRPLRIARNNVDPTAYDNRLVIVGWGKTDTGRGSSFLQKGTTPIRTYEQCYGEQRVPSVLDMARRRRQTYRYSSRAAMSKEMPLDDDLEYEESDEDNASFPISYGNKRQAGSRWVPWQQNAGFSDGVICIGGIINGTFGALSYSGDSGGPAICRSANGEAVLCGASSFGSLARAMCATNPTKENCMPSFYTRVSRYSSWIEGIAGPQVESDLYKVYLFGKNTEKGEYPHQVHVTSADMKCGGTLLKADKIITAAQCVVDSKQQGRRGVKITAGIHDLKDSGQNYNIKGVAIYQGSRMVKLPFNNQQRKDYNRTQINQEVFLHDIAIITLESPVKGVRKFPKVPPPSKEPFAPTAVELSWRYDPKYSSVLQSRDYNLLSQSECNERLKRMEAAQVTLKTDPSIICAVEKYSGASTCDRELGGGVICKDEKGREVLCGIQVLRLCHMAFPNGFLNLGHYSEWINQQL